MRCLVVLMIETEQPEALSARKLVVETAKHNVLTAYDAQSGLDLLRRFPNVDVVLVHASLLETNPNLISDVKGLAPKIPIVLANPFKNMYAPEGVIVVDSHQPPELLTLFTKLFDVSTAN